MALTLNCSSFELRIDIDDCITKIILEQNKFEILGTLCNLKINILKIIAVAP